MKAILESHWVRHPRVWFLMGGLIWVLIVFMMIYSRVPPSDFHEEQAVIPEARPGQTVSIMVPVTRNLSRECSVLSSRTFFDANHAADILTSNQYVSAQGLALREKSNPGKLVFNVPVPKTAVAGRATVITENRYWCPLNPTTWIKPIDDSWQVYVDVVPSRVSQP